MAFMQLYSSINFNHHLSWAASLQHELEHGKTHEHSAIIKKLTRQIVQMNPSGMQIVYFYFSVYFTFFLSYCF